MSDAITLDALADNPALAATLAPEARQQLILKAASVIAACAAIASVANGHATPPPPVEGPEWLGPDDVAARFALDRRWLADHARELASRKIISKPSRKRVLYHAARLQRFLDSRCPA